MYSRILVPIDGSEPAAAGLQEAIRLGKSLGARLCLVHVVNEIVVASPFATGTFDPQQFATEVVGKLRREANDLLRTAESQARREGVETECRLLEALGCPAGEEIVRYARESAADLIVMGTHGRRGLRRIVVGSDAELVVRTSPVPVVLVRGTGNRRRGVKGDRPEHQASSPQSPLESS